MIDLKSQLSNARLYLVMGTGTFKSGPWLEVVERALRGGVDILQLRDYSLKDSELLSAAQKLREITRRFEAIFIVNNRPDIAKLADADGVHVGQEDLSLASVRKIIGDGKIVGVSTHAPEQARKAIADGADYIGVGPVFATPTKAGRTPVSLEYVRQVAALNPAIPFFAIGGIDLTNLNHVQDAGAGRIAVVRAIAEASDPQKVAADFKNSLANHPPAGARP